MNKYLTAVSANILFFAINTLFFILITPVSIFVMGNAFFGIWSILYSLVLMSSFGTLGIEAIVTKIAAETPDPSSSDRKHLGAIFTGGLIIILITSALIAFIIVLTRGLIAERLATSGFASEELNLALLFIAVSIIPYFLTRVPKGILLSRLKNYSVRAIDTTASIMLWLGALTIVWVFGKEIVLISAWFLVVFTVALLIYFVALRHSTHIDLVFDSQVIRRMLRFSGPMLLESSAITFFQQFDRIVVGFVLGPAAAGVYSVGSSVGLRMSMVIGQATEVMIPYASNKDSAQAHERLLFTFRRLTRFSNVVVLVLGSVLIIWMQEILTVWISPEYASEHAGVFRVLILAYCLLSMSRPGHQTLTGLGRISFTAIVYAIATGIMLFLVNFLAARYGLIGAGAANLAMVILLSFSLYVYKLLSGKIRLNQILLDFGSGIIVLAAVFALGFFEPATSTKLLATLLAGMTAAIILSSDQNVRRTIMDRFKQVIL
jgi:O-antigen/teichoic acid export membrane protein